MPNIIEAIKHPDLFRPFLENADGKIGTWKNWLCALRVLYGDDTHRRYNKLIRGATGRDANRLPIGGFDTALFLTGRRSGKSRVAGLAAAFEAALGNHESKLAPGDIGMVVVMAPSKPQSRIVREHIRAAFRSTAITEAAIAHETKDGFTLTNGVRIEILAGDWRTTRGYTLLAAILDEVCFFGNDPDSKVKSDSELVRAVKPSLATTQGKLIAISSPYAKRGWAYDQWQKQWGNDKGDTLVWKCPSRTMNPTLSQSFIDKEIKRDPAANRAEYYAEWRDDVASFISRDQVEKCVVPGRFELLPNRQYTYHAFADISGGRADDATLAIAYKADDAKIHIAKLCRYRPPFSPQEIIRRMAHELRRYWLSRVTGDNYSAQFVVDAFRNCGISYHKTKKTKNELYGELLPRLNSQEIRLLDNKDLVEQLCNLERRTRIGGRDVIDHAPRAHDDLANAVAGVVDVADRKRVIIGSWDSLPTKQEPVFGLY